MKPAPDELPLAPNCRQDINNIFATGFFAAVDAAPEDTDLGVRVTYVVQPNPVLTEVNVEGNRVLPEEVVDEIFADQRGQIIKPARFSGWHSRAEPVVPGPGLCAGPGHRGP